MRDGTESTSLDSGLGDWMPVQVRVMICGQRLRAASTLKYGPV